MYKKRSYPRRKTSHPKRKYAKRVYKRKTSLVKTIKKVIHQQTENKVQTYYAANQTLTYAGSIANPTYIQLTPSPTIGTTVQNRIGNRIRVMKGIVNGYVNVLPYSATVNYQPSPIYIKMWLCKRKSYNIGSGGLPGTNDFANFFQTGSTSVGFQSNMLDMVFKVNHDYWTCYTTKTIQLQNCGYYAQQSNAILASNAAVSHPFSFSFAKHLGMCQFNDATQFPENKELFLVFQPVYADGSSAVVALQLAEIHYNVEWQYEDL